MNRSFIVLILALSVVTSTSCTSKPKTAASTTPPLTLELRPTPEFRGDSARSFVQAQVAFGPRVPNTLAHQACKDYLVGQFERFGASVIQQQANVRAFDGTILKATNIVASYQPDLDKRILLCAHWDSRPWADQDPDSKKRKEPILGANDGGSGVGVLMELARLLGIEAANNRMPNLGIDILLFDAEDYGYPSFYPGREDMESWCLGAQYWGKNPHKIGYKARYGILLDMVGDPEATFYWDYYSVRYASPVLENVWSIAAALGHASHFIKKEGMSVMDDHYYVNTLARIPCIDIIDTREDSGFVPYWHTHRDDMRNISASTLAVVGQTLLQVLYQEAQ